VLAFLDLLFELVFDLPLKELSVDSVEDPNGHRESGNVALCDLRKDVVSPSGPELPTWPEFEELQLDVSNIGVTRILHFFILSGCALVFGLVLIIIFLLAVLVVTILRAIILLLFFELFIFAVFVANNMGC
jgi:hypothetical protein